MGGRLYKCEVMFMMMPCPCSIPCASRRRSQQILIRFNATTLDEVCEASLPASLHWLRVTAEGLEMVLQSKVANCEEMTSRKVSTKKDWGWVSRGRVKLEHAMPRCLQLTVIYKLLSRHCTVRSVPAVFW